MLQRRRFAPQRPAAVRPQAFRLRPRTRDGESAQSSESGSNVLAENGTPGWSRSLRHCAWAGRSWVVSSRSENTAMWRPPGSSSSKDLPQKAHVAFTRGSLPHHSRRDRANGRAAALHGERAVRTSSRCHPRAGRRAACSDRPPLSARASMGRRRSGARAEAVTSSSTSSRGRFRCTPFSMDGGQAGQPVRRRLPNRTAPRPSLGTLVDSNGSSEHDWSRLLGSSEE
jgi:hypothetical protein